MCANEDPEFGHGQAVPAGKVYLTEIVRDKIHSIVVDNTPTSLDTLAGYLAETRGCIYRLPSQNTRKRRLTGLWCG